MKLQIFIRTFWAPIVLLIFLFLRLESGLTNFQTFAAIVFFSSILFSRLLNDARYIRSLTIQDDQILINYLNHFFNRKTIEVPVKNITGMKLSKKTRIALWPPTLEIKMVNDKLAFNILTEDQYDEIQHQLDSINLHTSQNNFAPL